ncbi:MAG: response regulator [Rhodospirillales bacterium]|nr:response regulator [Rhodospirillales bacterium]
MSENSYEAQMAADFSGEAKDILAQLEVMVQNMQSGAYSLVDGMHLIADNMRTLRLLSMDVGHHLMQLALERVDHYLSGLHEVQENNLSDMEIFVYVLSDILNGEIAPNVDQGEFIRSLPVLRAVDVSEIVNLDIEILLVEPQKSTARLFERELLNSGYRVHITNRSFSALEWVVRTKPDFIVSSAILDEMSGIDLALALQAIPSTSKVPFAILTSFAKGDKGLEGLPENVELINKGKQFSADMAKALGKFKVI